MKRILLQCTLLIFLLSTYSWTQQWIYVVNAYDGDSIPMPVKTVFVDLDTKAILNEIYTGPQGQLINKKPLPVQQGADTVLLSLAMEGCYCDNSIVGQNLLRVSVFDPAIRQLINSRADTNIFMDWFEKVSDNAVYLSGETLQQPRQSMNGDYILGINYDFELKMSRTSDYAYDIYSGSGSFLQLSGLAIDRNLYKGNQGTAWFVVKTNDNRTAIVDSLALNNSPYRSHIMAIIDSFLYDFNLNWEMHTEYTQKDYGQDWIDSHVRIYRLSDFAPLDSIPVPDYSPGDYPDGSFDVADVVGPFIVYYFFGREGLNLYAPAMLFIFDTRTNEATWLRVGWR